MLENHKWNYDYVRLALDTGFCFKGPKTENFDKTKISLIDIDRIIRERDIASIENLIPSVIQFVLEPDQAQILDETFVKTFRISQLSVQYLLFCKKYLDNTLVLIKEEITKIKEENKELKLFVEDLKAHISALMKELNEKNTTSFKCELCNKVFSSEEFLNSHKKRRHIAPVNPPPDPETDKLHSEIKELKGRLNSAEQMIQREQASLKAMHKDDTDLHVLKESELKKIEELQRRFEDLRMEVQSELKILQSQHNFQEKYEKLFEKMTLQNVKSYTTTDKDENRNLTKRRESTTQTDTDLKETFGNLEHKNESKTSEDVNANQKQFAEFGEALETKVTSSLQKIENQMQSFWNKLNEMEVYKRNSQQYSVSEEQEPPPVKPRSKYTVKSSKKVADEGGTQNKHHQPPSPQLSFEEEITKNDVPSPQKPTQQSSFPQQKNLVETKLPELKNEIKSSDSESSSYESESSQEKLKVPKKVLPKQKQTVTNTRLVDDEILERFRDEVEKIIMRRLQDLGVSPDWKGLPTKSFLRAMEIVNHQATLIKKTYPNFDLISTQIEKNLAKKLKEKSKLQKIVEKEKHKRDERKIKVSRNAKKMPGPQVEIKNRRMYETDSDSDVVKKTNLDENLKHLSEPYSAVIEELKTKTTKIDGSDKSDSVKEEKITKGEEQTKGVLKNYPSVGSLTKKKVLFNLNEDKKVYDKDQGSSTSIASSVFDGTPRDSPKENTVEAKKEKDIEDLSDFDFSDI